MRARRFLAAVFAAASLAAAPAALADDDADLSLDPLPGQPWICLACGWVDTGT